MGITGLLPKLSSITRHIHISQLENCKVGVDAYVWLHRGAYSCSYELCQNIETNKYINYCMKMVNLLRQYNVTPVLIFDGGNLPSKVGQEKQRRERREENRRKGIEMYKQGNLRAANEYFQRAVDVTPKMALTLINVLKKEGIEYIVAPYEADAQLTYLCINNLVDAVITEDSDLIPYGCPRIIYKLDKYGNAQEILLTDVGSAKEFDFQNFTLEMLRHMCILSGCDYISSIPGLGLKKAYNLLKTYREIDKVFNVICKDKKYNIPENYIQNFKKADITFLHQIVYDPRSGKTVPLRPLPKGITCKDIPFVGKELDVSIAKGIAQGELDPHTYLSFSQTLEEQKMEIKVSENDKCLVNNISHDKTRKESVTYTIKKSNLSSPTVNQKNRIINYFKVSRMREEVIDYDPPFMPKRKKLSPSKKEGTTSENDSPVIVTSKYFNSTSVTSVFELFHSSPKQTKQTNSSM